MSWSWKLLFFICHILINFVGLTIAQPVFLLTFCQENIGNYTNNSIYEDNLKTLLFSLSTNIDSYGFYNASVGQNSDQVNAIVLCRGDVELDVCRTCVNDSAYNILQRCPNYKEAIGGYDYCILRYSNRSIFSTLQINPAALYPNDNYVSSSIQFNQALKNLLDNQRKRAASGDSRQKFATGNTSGPNFQTIYALLQCTPDLSQWQCNECLDGAAGQIPACCGGKIGGRVIRPSCNLRFEINHFYNDTPSDALVPPPGKNNNKTRTVIIVVPSIVAIVILIVCILIFRRKTKHTKLKEEIKTVDEISCIESLQHDFGTIKFATDNFSNSNKLGQGGFGAVYKGKLPNGKEIAVKRLSANSGQGELEFKNEVWLVAKLQHRNLVRLLGFCVEGIERLLLYEFVANSSLDKFIFDPVKQAFLDWDKRYKIIEGVARGLLYLHEDSRLRIIHRDLKASNVLLDDEMNPKISDFGMAKLFVLDETHGETRRIVGTYGYMAPEYAMHGNFSVKSDVFSFGVLVLEILSGQKNNNFRNGENVEDLLSYAWKNWQEGKTSSLIHPSLRASARSVQDMNRCIHIGLLCVQENVADRPTIASVVLMLSSFSLTLPAPSKPAFFMHSSSDLGAVMTESSQLESKSNCWSVNGTSITDLYPR